MNMILKKRCTTGLSLVEILVAMTAFAVIFTGLASTFQALMIANRVTTDLSECLHHYKDGMRLLLDGDPTHPTEPHAGLMQADNVATAPQFVYSYTDEFGAAQNPTIDGALCYWVDGVLYTVWCFRGQILRMREAATPRPLMGDLPENPPRRRIMLSDTTTLAGPFGSFVTEELASSTRTLVRLAINLHGDTDNNAQPDVTEARLRMRPTVFLRNAEPEI
ncbi:MAG: hypothetical protein A2W80_18195 [Candidatus Riflebacteria bacterium GWC2_50_8]|nr:MAG: hypothetical protein A2W80_18195 [Candidatus Riflebacteria bacterium GWC2_50_8]